MKNEERILNILESMQLDIKSLKDGQATTNLRLDALEKGQTNLETGQIELHKDVADIKRDLKGVWSDIKRLDKRLTVQEKELDSLWK